jgi:helicase-exonuclease AddAB AddA subunit
MTINNSIRSTDAENKNKEEKKEEKKGTISFSPVQQQVIDARGSNVVVSASAGAGKTAVLVQRLCDLVVKDGISIENILAMTFTDDAAAEMKVRLKKELAKQDQSDPEIARQLSLLDTASISTIHSFCLDIIRQYYYLTDLTYTRANTVDTGMRSAAALEKAYAYALEKIDSEKAAALRLYMQANGKNDEDLQKLVLKFLDTALSKPDANAWMEASRKENPKTHPWFLKRFETDILAMQEIFRDLQNFVYTIDFPKENKREEIQVLIEKKLERLDLCLQDLKEGSYRKFGRDFIEYFENTGKIPASVNKVSLAVWQTPSKKIEGGIFEVLFLPEEYEQNARETEYVQSAFVDLAKACKEEFARIKKEEEFLDFSDMEQYAWQILSIPQAAEEVKNRFAAILVDEFQDTNDLQENIINAISRGDNVFRVGDIKQSIYGFRQARPEIMQKYLEHPDVRNRVIYMQENYRSKANLIEFNNRFFTALMNTPPLASQFQKEDEAVAGSDAQFENTDKPVRFLYTCTEDFGLPEKPDESSKSPKVKAFHKNHRYDLIAADIEKKVEQDKAHFRDFAILTRSASDHEKIKEALASRGIRAHIQSKKGFYTNKAVQIVLAALRLSVNPYDDIAFTAVLCSPLAGGSAKDAAALAAARAPGSSLYAAMRSGAPAAGMPQFFKYLRASKEQSLSRLLAAIYQYRSFYQFSTSARDKTNLDLLLEKACAAEGQYDLEQFVSSCRLEEDLDSIGQASPFGKEEDAVKVGTMHSSKGLQYKTVYVLVDEKTRPDPDQTGPVLIDPDLGAAFSWVSKDGSMRQTSMAREGVRFKKNLEEQQEKMRLLYVAATRAKEELVFVGYLKEEDEYADYGGRQMVSSDKGMLSWVVSTLRSTPGLQVKMERISEPVKPGDKKVPSSGFYKPQMYSGKNFEIFSATASAAKTSLRWPKTIKPMQDGSGKGKERGTVFHEMAEKLSYPYSKKDMQRYGAEKGMEWGEEDERQMLSLNSCPQYQKWMQGEHTFECPYTVLESNPETGAQKVVHGYMDLLAYDGEYIDILDFKTDRVMDMIALESKYKEQLNTYKRALQQIYPNRPVRTWIYSFHLKEMQEIK